MVNIWFMMEIKMELSDFLLEYGICWNLLENLPKCLFLVVLINRNSLRAASYLVFKTMTHLNSLKPCILSFTFEAVAKTCSKC